MTHGCAPKAHFFGYDLDLCLTTIPDSPVLGSPSHLVSTTSSYLSPLRIGADISGPRVHSLPRPKCERQLHQCEGLVPLLPSLQPHIALGEVASHFRRRRSYTLNIHIMLFIPDLYIHHHAIQSRHGLCDLQYNTSYSIMMPALDTILEEAIKLETTLTQLNSKISYLLASIVGLLMLFFAPF